MTDGPPGEPRKFDRSSVVLGAVLGAIGSVGLPLVLGLLSGLGDALGFFLVVAGLGLLVPLVVGIVLTATPGTPQRRGFGLGMIIGWGLLVLVGGGLCFVLIASLSHG